MLLLGWVENSVVWAEREHAAAKDYTPVPFPRRPITKCLRIVVVAADVERSEFGAVVR
ncbi:hypothetical protein [Nocardia anaemiae]|uniref:hypothetical protein n=1 Tax=Nocardia anaemiae TaxID=263910 RepID=UPI0012F4E0E2|nr:hypothetical protein [Nocardia anaemiae]